MDEARSSETSRRAFLRSVAGGAAAAAVTRVARAAPEAGNRRPPNVVFLFSDEHRWQSMSFTEMPKLHTPNMQRMAAQGLSFNRSISNYPVCSPYRAILMTGRWPYQTGVIDNGIPLRPSETTIGRVFKEAGYATCYIGKWHLGGTRAEPFGFDRSLIWSRTGNHWRSRFHPRGERPAEVRQYNASAMTDQALAFMRENRDRPFFAMVSWDPPHYRFTDAPDKKKALYPEGSIPQRPNFAAREGNPLKGVGAQNTWPVYQGYHAHVSAIDDELGRILDALDEMKLAGDTIVVYTSDHGSLLGSHGAGGKRQPYEESIRTPFLVRWPGTVLAGQTNDALLGAIDVMPSILGLAGISVPQTCVGQDLSPLMWGGEVREPESQFIMHIAKKNASGGEKHPAPLFRGVTTGRHTYAVYPDRPWCLFDNHEDPFQVNNRIHDIALAEIRKDLRARLADWLKKAGDPFIIPG